jgi:hypothetical protein
MHDLTIASLMARDSTRRHIDEPRPETQPRRLTRRLAARALQAAAYRLDPCVTAPPQVRLGRQ